MEKEVRGIKLILVLLLIPPRQLLGGNEDDRDIKTVQGAIVLQNWSSILVVPKHQDTLKAGTEFVPET
jgi:hypothetical protein